MDLDPDLHVDRDPDLHVDRDPNLDTNPGPDQTQTPTQIRILIIVGSDRRSEIMTQKFDSFRSG